MKRGKKAAARRAQRAVSKAKRKLRRKHAERNNKKARAITAKINRFKALARARDSKRKRQHAEKIKKKARAIKKWKRRIKAAAREVVKKKRKEKAVKRVRALRSKTKALMWKRRLRRASTQLVKNIASLKVFAMLLKDKIRDSFRHMGVFGIVLRGMSQPHKMGAVKQYIKLMRALRRRFKAGLPQYTMRHFTYAMGKKGGILILHGSKRKTVRVSSRVLGLRHTYPALKKLAAPASTYYTQLANFHRTWGKYNPHKKKKQQKFSQKDYDSIFKGKCETGFFSTKGRGSSCTSLTVKWRCIKRRDCVWKHGWLGH
jgi:hypothetical protein